MTRTSQGRYQGTYTPVISGTYAAHVELSAFGVRTVPDDTYFVA